jgi:glycosyltransferase involved in cell wall biosynthesis
VIADKQGGSWPAVSVVVPTRHRPELLLRAVTSILGQTYPGELECLVIFDQSEPTPPLLGEMPAGRHLRVLTNIRKPGLAGARNVGITAAAGSVIAFCDDDDTWRLDKLALQVELLNMSAADFVACGVQIHYSDHAVVRIPSAQTGFDQLVRNRMTALHSSAFVIRRSALDDIGLVDEEIPGAYGEDYDLLLRAAKRSPVLAVQQPLVDVLWHEQSFYAEHWQTISDALRYMLAKYPALSADSLGRARIEGQIAFAEAALARRGEACRFVWRALRANPAEPRAYLALAVAARVIPATSIVRAANRRGHGI